MELKNLPELSERINKAILQKERIILYGDSDMDGVSSVLIMKEAIKNKGGEIAVIYFPDREEEGYGLTKQALEQFKDLAPAVIIMMDMGISNFEEIESANKKKFEVLMIDHHQPLEGKLPKASIIVDPKQPGEEYPFAGFAACGLTWKVAERLMGDANTEQIRKSMLELATLCTIADMMPREADNVEIIEEGIPYIERSWRPGIQVFFSFPPFEDFLSLEEKITHMISVLNVRDVKDGFPAAYRLLTALGEEEAQELLGRLWELNKVRQDNIRAFVEEAEERAVRHKDDPIIFEGTKELDYVLLGKAASILAERHQKPVFLYRERGEQNEALGSVRAPKGYDTVVAMTECADLLYTYGGHAQASGFRLSLDNLEEFKKQLTKYFLSHGKNA